MTAPSMVTVTKFSEQTNQQVSINIEGVTHHIGAIRASDCLWLGCWRRRNVSLEVDEHLKQVTLDHFSQRVISSGAQMDRSK